MDDMPTPTPAPAQVPTPSLVPDPNVKSRHGCLTTWLILLLIGSIGSLVLYIVQDFSMYPGWVVPVMILFCLVNLTVVILLFKWKKIGFWILCGNAILIFIVNLIIGVPIYTALGGLLGVVILYGVLNIGTNNKGWPQLD